ncbi:Bug family tripartite tricarboxylate transporter substrate binding protein [Falsiroseomonas sp. HW251]|uniref:Bug family tripartite tricarboxylate transporter substrate binding protein n=1 Tax=Falsiroseomonas sp. HW251 TaxID=3390998 RepID=UPI003D30F1DB
MMDRRHLLGLVGAAALPQAALAQGAFPARPVTLVVAFPPGASTDITARRIAPRATVALGQTMVVENRTGAAGNLAAGYVARAPADGYTLLHTNYVSLLIAKAANTRLDFDPFEAFVPVAQIGPNVNMLVVRPDLPVRTLPELVALAKRDPDKLTMGTIGIGSAYHMGLEWLNLAFGMRITHVPYRGAAEAVNDLLGGRIDMMFSSLTLAKPHLEANRMRAIAMTNLERAPMFPDMPTIAEQGVPGFDLMTQTAIFAPAGTPGAAVAKVNDAINAALADGQVKAQLESDGVILTPMTPAAFAQQLQGQLATIREVFARTGIRLE